MSGHGGSSFLDDDSEKEHENEERWLLTYADMMTLLVAFFIMMYSMSVLNLAKFKQLAIAIKSGFSGEMDAAKGDTVIGEEKSISISPIVVNSSSGSKGGAKHSSNVGQDKEDSIFSTLKQDLINLQTNKKLQGIIDIKEKSGNIYIVIITDKIFFVKGTATLTEEAKTILGDIGAIIRPLKNEVSVEGYTGSAPPIESKFKNNWELSAGRSITVISFFQNEAGIDPQRLSLTGYGEYRPIFGQDDNPNANDRVVIAVMKKTFKGGK
jgi:chemotaxis protein MotB